VGMSCVDVETSEFSSAGEESKARSSDATSESNSK